MRRFRPKTDPCGTPVFAICNQYLITTFCFRSLNELESRLEWYFNVIISICMEVIFLTDMQSTKEITFFTVFSKLFYYVLVLHFSRIINIIVFHSSEQKTVKIITISTRKSDRLVIQDLSSYSKAM